jgi:hypothetical protein
LNADGNEIGDQAFEKSDEYSNALIEQANQVLMTDASHPNIKHRPLTSIDQIVRSKRSTNSSKAVSSHGTVRKITHSGRANLLSSVLQNSHGEVLVEPEQNQDDNNVSQDL